MYKRQYWQDHVTQYENRFRETNNRDGTINHIPVEGEVLQEGTPQNASNFNNLEEGLFAANELGGECTRVLLQQRRELNMVKGESGTVTLTNTLAYPFNNSVVTVPLVTKRDTIDYTVEVDADAGVIGNVGRFIITDRLLNGFKIAFTGGAASVTVKYTVRGGVL